MKSEKVFITGCGGMLGNAIYPFFKSWCTDVLATDKTVSEDWLVQLDVRDEEGVKKIFDEYDPKFVLHLAAETDLEYCETHPDITKDVNELSTKMIARLAEEFGATLIYISTAGVFDGEKNGYYTEEDSANPIMVYGQTKYDGEVHALENCSRTYVVRAGWMMGGGRRKEKKFIYKILQQVANGKKEIFAVDDKWGTPTYTYDFAMNLFLLLETKKYGRYHMVCEGKGTRYDVAEEILRICNRPDIKLNRVGSDYFAEEYFAPRPYSEMMINSKLSGLEINHMRPWREALKDYIQNHFPDYIMSPTEWIGDKLTEKNEESAPSERRSFFRKNYPSSIDYIIKNGYVSPELKKAITINVSKEGLCFYVFDPVNNGEQFRFIEKSGVIEYDSARVQWIKKEKNGIYKAGLKFLDKNE